MFPILALLLAVSIPVKPAARVYDGAALLNPAAKSEIEQKILKIEAKDHLQLGLLTVSNLDDDPKSVSDRTLSFWQMGPNSVLMLVSTNPKKIYIEPGAAMAPKFSQSVSAGISRDIIAPYLRSGNFAGGINAGFAAIVHQATIRINTAAPAVMAPVAQSSSSGGSGFLMFICIVGGLALFLYVLYLIFRTRNTEYVYSGGSGSNFVGYNQPARPVLNTFRSATVSSAPVSSGVAAPTTTVVNNVNSGGGSGDLLTGVILGEELASNNPRANVVYEPVYEPAPIYSGGGSSYDPESSGGGSDWSSGGGSDYDSDSSGGGSDWSSDSGGGFDFGGGSDW